MVRFGLAILNNTSVILCSCGSVPEGPPPPVFSGRKRALCRKSMPGRLLRCLLGVGACQNSSDQGRNGSGVATKKTWEVEVVRCAVASNSEQHQAVNQGGGNRPAMISRPLSGMDSRHVGFSTTTEPSGNGRHQTRKGMLLFSTGRRPSRIL